MALSASVQRLNWIKVKCDLASLHLYDVIWFPGLVEKLDARTVETHCGEEVSSIDGLDEIRIGRFSGLRWTEPDVDGPVAIRRDLAEAVDRRQQLRRLDHCPIRDVVGGDGPEQLRGRVRRQVQLVGVRAIEEI